MDFIDWCDKIFHFVFWICYIAAITFVGCTFWFWLI